MKKGRKQPTRIIRSKRGQQINIKTLVEKIEIHGAPTKEMIEKAITDSLISAIG
jgi:hypothetical protein